MKLLRTDVVIFIFIFLLTIAIVSFILLINPETIPQTINQNPLPQVNPGWVNDSSPQVMSSCKTLLSCANQPSNFCNQNCQNKQDQINYECKTIVNEVSNPDYTGNVFYNGTKVPDGQWCLPAFQDNLVCNTYMDSYIWADYAGMQEWACYQNYPQFFNNGVYLGCKDFSEPGPYDNVDSIVNYQINNKLVEKNNPNNVYDPLGDSNFALKWQNVGPYAKNSSGDNILECGCGIVQTYDEQGNLNNGMTVQLPNDPYNCHLNPCLVGGIYLQSSDGTIETGLSTTGPTGAQVPICDCSLLTKLAIEGTGVNDSTKAGVAGQYYAKSPYKNICANASITCGNNLGSLFGGQGSSPLPDGNPWDSQNNICLCSATKGYYAVNCRSKIVDEYIKNNPTDPKIGEMNQWPKCKDYDFNLLGSECRAGCTPEESPCQSITQCHIRDNKVYCSCPGAKQSPPWNPNIWKYCPAGTGPAGDFNKSYDPNMGVTYFGDGALQGVDLPYADSTGIINYLGKGTFVIPVDQNNNQLDGLYANCSQSCMPSGQICGVSYSLLNDNLDGANCVFPEGCTRNGVWGGACCSGVANLKAKYQYGTCYDENCMIKDDGVWYYECQ